MQRRPARVTEGPAVRSCGRRTVEHDCRLHAQPWCEAHAGGRRTHGAPFCTNSGV